MLAALALMLWVSEYRYLIQKTWRQESSNMDKLAGVAKEAIITKNDFLVVYYFKEYKRNLMVKSVALQLPDGQFSVHTDTRFMGTVRQDAEDFWALSIEGPAMRRVKDAQENIRELVVPIYHGAEKLAIVRVEYYEDIVHQLILKELYVIMWGLMWVGVGVLLIGFFGAMLLALTFTRPIEQLVAAVRSIGEGKWEKRIDMERSDELGYLATEFNQMAKKLEDLYSAQQFFVRSLTHDLGAPLAGIRGYVDLWHDGVDLGSEKTQQALATMRVATDRMKRALQETLDLFKIRAGRMQLSKKHFSLRDLAAETVRILAPLGDARKMKIRVQSPVNNGEMDVFADRDKISQVITNLISNALKYTPQGAGDILVRIMKNEKATVLCVADKGPGMTEEDQKKIFLPFYRIQSDAAGEKIPGTGLGLAIAQGIVEAHNGRIWVESQLGKGTKFYFALPNDKT